MKKTQSQKIFSQIALLASFIVTSLAKPILVLGSTDWADREGDPVWLVDFETVFARIVQIVTIFAGIGILAAFLTGGFKYLTAGDNPKAVEEAGKTLTLALGGLAVILSAWLILQAIETLTGFKVTVFRLNF